jgi:hypothetical protein
MAKLPDLVGGGKTSTSSSAAIADVFSTSLTRCDFLHPIQGSLLA